MTDELLIKNLIKKGEDNHLAFMEKVDKAVIAKTVCGFLNSDGGIILLGVKKNKGITGVNHPVLVIRELKTFLLNSITPEVPIAFSLEQIGNLSLIMIMVLNGSKPPYLFKNSIYIRKSTRTTLALPEDTSDLISERQINELHWERQTALGASINDLDLREINNTLRDIANSGRSKSFAENDVESFLSYYGLFRNGNLTNAAVLLFSKEPTKFLPQSRVRLTVFPGNKSSNTFSYDRMFEGNLFKNIMEIEQFLDVNIGRRVKFTDSNWRRIDEGFPIFALREGVLNSLIHRDYSNISGTTLIGFYPNRLEISNYGELPAHLKPSDLTKNHLSFPRNPDIAHICFLRGLTENIGRGTLKMIDDCENKGYPKPIWESKSGLTTLIFREIELTALFELEKTDLGQFIIRQVLDSTLKSSIHESVKERLVDMTSFIASHPGVKISELLSIFKISESVLKNNIKKLIDSKMINYLGSRKTGGYFPSEFLQNQLHKK